MSLPRLSVVSDVPVDDTVSGPKLLFRLLQDYDKMKLAVIEGSIWPSQVSRRLPIVQYETLAYVPGRLMRTRLAPYCGMALLWGVRLVTRRLAALLSKHQVQAVLTVAHGYLWIAAAAAAHRLGVPLHLIIHDDWPSCIPDQLGARRRMTQELGKLYRQTASRLCVSEYMEEEYRREYGVPGTILLPSRGEDSPDGRVRFARNGGERPFTVVFMGTIGTSYIGMLRQVAEVLLEMKGQLHLYTDQNLRQLKAFGLDAPNIRLQGFLPPRVVAERVWAMADVLFVPMSFDSRDKRTMTVSFPSKLVDYTAFGLPLLIWGPSYCSAVRWSEQNKAGAVLVTNPERDALREPLARLATDTSWCLELAGSAVAVGNRAFSLKTARGIFYSALSRGLQ